MKGLILYKLRFMIGYLIKVRHITYLVSLKGPAPINLPLNTFSKWKFYFLYKDLKRLFGRRYYRLEEKP